MFEWIQCGKTWDEFKRSNECKTGMVLEIQEPIDEKTMTKSPGYLLVGDINEVGGVCDDCCGIGYADVITRYTRVVLP